MTSGYTRHSSPAQSYGTLCDIYEHCKKQKSMMNVDRNGTLSGEGGG